jgi:hypothetical protein
MISQRFNQNERDGDRNYIIKISPIERSIWLDVA